LVAIAAGLAAPIGYPGLKGFLFTFMIAFLTVGFGGGLYFFELRKKKQYYLFYNLGWSRLQLFLFSFLINLSILIPLWLFWKTL